MSRIGKQPIPLDAAVTATVEGSHCRVKGPKGELDVVLHPRVTATVAAEPKQITVSVGHPEDRTDRALWGLTRQLIANAVRGVVTPYEKSLEFVGVGYKVSVSGNTVHMDVGFSHAVDFPLPPGIEANVAKNVLTLSGSDRQLVGETAARIRRIRPPEPYKGKGIKYTDETIRRKAGKTAAKA